MAHHDHDGHQSHGFVAHGLFARVAAACLAFPILVYRYTLSPLLPPSCRFAPSCSAYALEALKLHGPLKGSALAAKRFARCHPVSWLGGGSGFDPVPKP